MRPTIISILLFIICGELGTAQSPASVPGTSSWGEERFIEYVAGDLPVVISVPHDGELTPEIIADRTFGVNARDNGTQEIAKRMIVEFRKRTGRTPHVIFSHLRRTKLDVNREEFEAAQDSETAMRAWNEYHALIDTACFRSLNAEKFCLYIDLHGQKHPEGRIEIGYRLENEDLARTDEELNAPAMVQKSSLQWLVRNGTRSHAELVRGSSSFGALFDRLNVRSTPSPSDPYPDSYKFYSGGYTLYRHAVETNHGIIGVQFELNPELREHRHSAATAAMLTEAVLEYMKMHGNKDYTEK